MKPIFILILLCPTWLFAQEGSVTVPGFSASLEAKAQPIGITGPTTAKAGSEIVLRLTGTPQIDLTKPLVEQLDWLMGKDRMFVYWAAPYLDLMPVDVHGELVFSASGATMQPLMRVVCGEPGEYRLLVDWNSGQDQLAEHRVKVGEGPEPKPEPKPDPKPTPGKVTWGVIVEERSQRTDLPIQQRYVFESTAVRGLFAAEKFLVVDRNSTDPAMKAYIDQAAKVGVPALFLADDQGNIAFQGPLPATVDETVKLIGSKK